jgi:hypothetical protein
MGDKVYREVDGRPIPTLDVDDIVAGAKQIRMGIVGTLRVDTGFSPAVAEVAGTISEVKAYRSSAGSASSTIVDVNKGGVTIFTTQANRPTFAFGDGDDAIVDKTPDVTSFVEDDIFTLDIDQLETGAPQGYITVIIKFS